MNKYISLILFSLFVIGVSAQDLDAFPLSATWLSKIDKNAPAPTEDTEDTKKNVLIFSLHTGFEHWTIPHTEAVMGPPGQ